MEASGETGFMSGTIKGYQMGAESNKRKPELVSTAD